MTWAVVEETKLPLYNVSVLASCVLDLKVLALAACTSI
jgi:hypothetical protein